MNLYEISLELPDGKTINVLISDVSVTAAEREVRDMLRSLQEEALLSGRTSDLDFDSSHAVELREVWATA